MTICNINQGRSSFFHSYGLSANKTLLNAVLKQAYFGSRQELKKEEVRTFRDRKNQSSQIFLFITFLFQIAEVASIFASEEVITKGLLADYMFQITPYRERALKESRNQSVDWQSMANESYIREAGWYFKTLAVQEVGELD